MIQSAQCWALSKKVQGMKTTGKKLILLSASAVLTACGGGSNPSSSNTGAIQTGTSATVSVSFPNLFDQGGIKVLPTYFSHVISSSTHPLANITLQNTGGPLNAQITIDLPNYGSAASQTVMLAAGETKSVTISPIINYTQLFQNTTALPAAVTVSVTAGGSNLFAQTYPIQITGKNTVFWSSSGTDVSPLIATMVTPQDKAQSIQSVLRGAANRFLGGTQMIGYQAASWPAGSYTIAPGTWQHEGFYLLAGESPDVAIDNVTTSLGAADSTMSVFILDDANYTKWAAGQSAPTCALSNATPAGTILQCSPQPTAGMYHVVYYNPPSNVLNRTVTRHRTMTKWEVTFYQANAIFDELRARGLAYINLPGSGFFSSAQNVRYPAESLATQSANCIDGSLLFASVFEALGMEPVIAMSMTAGHAFAAVRCWAGSTDCVVPIETTMVGGTATFGDASISGGTSWDSWRTGGHLKVIDIKAARSIGLLPAPM